VPYLKRASVLFFTRNPYNHVYLREMEPAAAQMNVELHQFLVAAAEEIPKAFAAMAAKRIEATVIGEDPVLNTSARTIAALAVAHRLPASGFTNFADAGGLLGYGANRPQVYARAANFADKIFRGAKAGDLPIERASRFELVVNLNTARKLGLKIPDRVLARADRVIE